MTKTCPQCNKEFLKPYTESKKAWELRHKFCSKICYTKSMKGRVSLKKGIPSGIVAWNKGLSGFMGGNKHYNWKGGLGNERHTAMGQLKYKNWRNLVFYNDNYTCQMCEQQGGYLHADHIKGWAKYPELRYVVSNGRTLCRACHYFITFKKKIVSWSKWGLTRAYSVEA